MQRIWWLKNQELGAVSSKLTTLSFISLAGTEDSVERSCHHQVSTVAAVDFLSPPRCCRPPVLVTDRVLSHFLLFGTVEIRSIRIYGDQMCIYGLRCWDVR